VGLAVSRVVDVAVDVLAVVGAQVPDQDGTEQRALAERGVLVVDVGARIGSADEDTGIRVVRAADEADAPLLPFGPPLADDRIGWRSGRLGLLWARLRARARCTARAEDERGAQGHRRDQCEPGHRVTGLQPAREGGRRVPAAREWRSTGRAPR